MFLTLRGGSVLAPLTVWIICKLFCANWIDLCLTFLDNRNNLAKESKRLKSFGSSHTLQNSNSENKLSTINLATDNNLPVAKHVVRRRQVARIIASN